MIALLLHCGNKHKLLTLSVVFPGKIRKRFFRLIVLRSSILLLFFNILTSSFAVTCICCFSKSIGALPTVEQSFSLQVIPDMLNIIGKMMREHNINDNPMDAFDISLLEEEDINT